MRAGGRGRARSASASRRTAAASRPNDRGDTYGPVAYEAYLPGYAVLGWSGKWDEPARGALDSIALRPARAARPRARRAAASAGTRLAVTLAVRLGRVPVHAVRVELEHERRDHARVPDLRLLARDVVVCARSASLALAGWTKFAALLLVPLWAGVSRSRAASPERPRLQEVLLPPRWPPSRSSCSSRTRRMRRESSGTGPSAGRSAATRRSRSGAGASTTRRESPTSALLQQVSIGLLAIGAVACYFVPRRKTPLQLAALTGALLIGFELVADALVLPLHPVVLPLRRVRRPGPAPAAGRGSSQ